MPRIHPVDRAGGIQNHREQQCASHARQHQFSGVGFNAHERAACRQHHTEDEQHKSSADVDQELRRTDKVGVEREKEPRRRPQRKNQPERHANHVLSDDHRHGGNHGRHGEDPESSVLEQPEEHIHERRQNTHDRTPSPGSAVVCLTSLCLNSLCLTSIGVWRRTGRQALLPSGTPPIDSGKSVVRPVNW